MVRVAAATINVTEASDAKTTTPWRGSTSCSMSCWSKTVRKTSSNSPKRA